MVAPSGRGLVWATGSTAVTRVPKAIFDLPLLPAAAGRGGLLEEPFRRPDAPSRRRTLVKRFGSSPSRGSGRNFWGAGPSPRVRARPRPDGDDIRAIRLSRFARSWLLLLLDADELDIEHERRVRRDLVAATPQHRSQLRRDRQLALAGNHPAMPDPSQPLITRPAPIWNLNGWSPWLRGRSNSVPSSSVPAVLHRGGCRPTRPSRRCRPRIFGHEALAFRIREAAGSRRLLPPCPSSSSFLSGAGGGGLSICGPDRYRARTSAR